ncbi:MAG: hypothetical protein II664_08360, partial [Oscillospiraceae bacterium]|nr:hypothetical protein [Oscillospiraceae bacterium]
AVRVSKKLDFIKTGDTVVITAGVPLGISGNTDLLEVQVVR